ncbi:MAG TPA: 16S rRNA (cytosine(1402)-N(4))-methyltransferase RsmH [bacterium]|nr:16S rRNA (cytosine(1402)-N(4))-methyltransferase RsmH [bacterium]
MNRAAESSETSAHIPVLVDEVLAVLAPRPGAVIVDATIGDGGHAEALLGRIAPAGRLIGLDRDADAVGRAEDRLRRFGQNLILRQASFADLNRVLDETGTGLVDGVLFDLGVSSRQLFESERGFSFDRQGPLDMRMDRGQTVTAADLVNTLRERDLADLIYRYGEERASRRIARQIVARRPLTTTRDLVRAVESAMGGGRGRHHPATRTFQALRIATNQEIEALEAGLPQAIGRLRAGGRICAIAFHSLEDRIVKQTFARYARGCTCPAGLPACVCGGRRLLRVITKKPVTPSLAEVRRNARARSARMRAAERLDEPFPQPAGGWAPLRGVA